MAHSLTLRACIGVYLGPFLNRTTLFKQLVGSREKVQARIRSRKAVALRIKSKKTSRAMLALQIATKILDANLEGPTACRTRL